MTTQKKSNIRDKKRVDHKRSQNHALSTQAKTVEIIERRYQIVELKRDGYSHHEIASSLGMSVSLVASELAEVLENTVELCALTVQSERQLQIERLDKITKTFMPYATKPFKRVIVDKITKQETIVIVPPDPDYAKLILSIEDRRAKLMGLDVPERKELEITAIREYTGVDMDKV